MFKSNNWYLEDSRSVSVGEWVSECVCAPCVLYVYMYNIGVPCELRATSLELETNLTFFWSFWNIICAFWISLTSVNLVGWFMMRFRIAHLSFDQEYRTRSWEALEAFVSHSRRFPFTSISTNHEHDLWFAKYPNCVIFPSDPLIHWNYNNLICQYILILFPHIRHNKAPWISEKVERFIRSPTEEKP